MRVSIPRSRAAAASSSAVGRPPPERVDQEKARQTPASIGPMASQFRPFGSCVPCVSGPIIRCMSDRGFHRIEADLEDSWLEDWAGVGIAELEEYLAKHAAFLSYLEKAKN